MNPKPFSFFNLVFCLTLPQSSTRQKFMLDQFNVLGIEQVQFVQGDYVEPHNIAATQSHLYCYHTGLWTICDQILILEDDCEFLPEIKNLSVVLDELQGIPNWDILYLGSHVYGETQKVSPHLNRVSKAVSLHAYGINWKCFKRLLSSEFSEKLKEKPLDLVICEDILPDGNCYVANPMMAKQHPSFSEVTMQNVDYDDMFESSKKWLK